MTVTLPRLSDLLFVNAALPLASVVSVTTPLKALPALARLIAPLVAVNDAMPATFRLVLAACVMLPALSMSVMLTPPMLALPSVSATLLTSRTSKAPVLASATAPLKALLALERLIAPLTALKLDAPLTVIAVFVACATLPTAITVSDPLATLTLPSVNA